MFSICNLVYGLSHAAGRIVGSGLSQRAGLLCGRCSFQNLPAIEIPL